MKNLIKNESFKLRRSPLLKWLFLMPPFIIAICVFYYLKDNELTVHQLCLYDVWAAVSQIGYNFVLFYFSLVLAAMIGRSYANKTIYYEVFYGYSYLQSACSRIIVNGMVVFLPFFLWYLLVLFIMWILGGMQQFISGFGFVFLAVILFQLIWRLSMIDIIVQNPIWACASGIVIEYIISYISFGLELSFSMEKQMMLLSFEMSHTNIFAILFSFIVTIGISFLYMLCRGRKSSRHFAWRE